MTRCPHCNSSISEKDGVPFCPNCQKTVEPVKGDPYPRKVPQRGERYKDFGPRNTIVTPSVPISASSKDKLKRNKKNKDIAEESPDTVKEVFVSDPINQCIDPRVKNKRNADIKKEDVMRSCEDLEIDG